MSHSHSPPKYIDKSNLEPVTKHFDFVRVLGKGAYACVTEMKEKKTGKTFAFKRLEYDETEERYIAREIKVMKKLFGHPNIVNLYGVYIDKDQHIHLQLELCSHKNFYTLLNEGSQRSMFSCLSVRQIKAYAQQLLCAVEYCAKKGVIHRDIKTENILLHDKTVKLADFGLSKEMLPNWNKYSPNLQTLWYRAPEMCLGFSDYDEKVDMWSYGCVLGEFIYGTPLLKAQCGKNDSVRECSQRQLDKIYELCGTPDPYEWAQHHRQAVRESFKTPRERVLVKDFMANRDKHMRRSFITPQAIDLIDSLLQLHPTKRLSATQALQHPYFTSEMPPPYAPSQMISMRTTSSPKREREK